MELSPAPAADPIAAILDQLAAHAERITRIDRAATTGIAAARVEIAALTMLAETLAGRVATLTGESTVPGPDAESGQAASEPSGAGRGGARSGRAGAGPAAAGAGPGGRPGGDEPDGWPYAPAQARRWWKLTGPDRDEAIAGLRAWVEQVYRPGYGQLAAAVGPCWEQHPLCLYGLDILAELWSVLYLAPDRSPAVLSAQAEFQARILPALTEQMITETTRCGHHRPTGTFARPPRTTP